MLTMTPADLTQAASDLYATADMIERDGWHQGSNWNDLAGKLPNEAPACFFGSAYKVVHGFPWYPTSVAALDRANAAGYAVAGFLKLPSLHAVASWNDERGRTAEEVCAVIRQAADKLTADSEV
jgi:hypothetical protein